MKKIVLIDCDSLLYKNIEDLDQYKDRIDEILAQIIESVGATHYKCFIEIENNVTFRKVEFKEYKAQRVHKPLHNKNEIRDYIIECYNPYISIGVETDDSIISTWKHLNDKYENDLFDYEMGEAEERPEYIEIYIAANDKDYLTYPINYIDLYHGRWLQQETISESDALYNSAFQLLMGDTSDNVKCLKGVGKVKAKKMLDELNVDSKISYAKLLIREYKKQYKSSRKAKNIIMDNIKLLRLKDNVRPCKWLEKVEFGD